MSLYFLVGDEFKLLSLSLSTINSDSCTHHKLDYAIMFYYLHIMYPRYVNFVSQEVHCVHTQTHTQCISIQVHIVLHTHTHTHTHMHACSYYNPHDLLIQGHSPCFFTRTAWNRSTDDYGLIVTCNIATGWEILVGPCHDFQSPTTLV